MATRTRRPVGTPTVEPVVTFASKSDWARSRLRAGIKVKDIRAESYDRGTPMDYAFIYGVAKRAGLNLTAADRKSTAKVKYDRTAGTVTIALDTGKTMTVDMATGKTRTK